MKNIKLILSVFIGSFVITSCVDDTTLKDMIDEQDNVIGFVETNRNIGAVANTGFFEFEFPVQATGPTLDGLSGSYTATVSVNSESTAQEGVHYNLPQTQFAITSDGGLRGLFSIEMLSNGIVTTPEDPLPSPTLILDVTNVDGSGNVVASGKQLVLTLDYLCNATLGQDYIVTHTRADGRVWIHNDHITETGLEVYRTETIERWGDGIGGTHSASNPLGDGGFEFLNVCNELTVPTQDLMNYYSNDVAQAGKSFVKENGDLRIVYSIVYSGDPLSVTADFVLQ